MRKLFLALVLFGVLGLAVWGASDVWGDMAGTEMSAGGIIALIVGSILTLAMGVGLMALVFYSHRKGYDDDAGKKSDE